MRPAGANAIATQDPLHPEKRNLGMPRAYVLRDCFDVGTKRVVQCPLWAYRGKGGGDMKESMDGWMDHFDLTGVERVGIGSFKVKSSPAPSLSWRAGSLSSTAGSNHFIQFNMQSHLRQRPQHLSLQHNNTANLPRPLVLQLRRRRPAPLHAEKRYVLPHSHILAIRVPQLLDYLRRMHALDPPDLARRVVDDCSPNLKGRWVRLLEERRVCSAVRVAVRCCVREGMS